MEMNRKKNINLGMQKLISFLWLLIQAVTYSFLLVALLLLIYKASTYLVRLL